MWRIRLPGLLVDRTICVSNAVRESLLQYYGYPRRRTMTVLNGVDLTYFHPSGKTKGRDVQDDVDRDSPVTLLCIGNLWRQKRVDILIEAMALVAKNHPSCRCIIVGDGPLLQDLRAHTTKLGLSTVVQFMGRAEDVRPYLEIADLFVLSSDNEGLPLVLGEAMAYGVPCIATDVGGNKEIVADGLTGLIVPPGSPVRLAQAIDYLLDRPDERRRMGTNALDRVQEHFDIDSSMGTLRHVLVEQ